MPTNPWTNEVPTNTDKISSAALRIRTFKLDVRERINESNPIGIIREWFTESAPDGWMECDGSSLLVASYTDLFAIIGYRYGGSGANFNIPDLRGLLVRCWRHGKSGVDLDADAAVSCTGNIATTHVTSITGLAGVPRIGASVTGTGIPADTYITSIVTYDADGIPTAFDVSQSCSSGSGITITIDNDILGSTQHDENKNHSHGVNNEYDTLLDPGFPYIIFNHANLFNTGSSGGAESRPKNKAVMYIIRTDTII